MAAGTQMRGGGYPVSYANSAITSGLTTGLLSVFTDVTNASPSAGSQMRPFLINPLGSNEPCYRVDYGSTQGTYSINRNDPQGEQFYNSWSGASYSLQNLRDYIHWPIDQRLRIDVQNTSPFIYSFGIKIASTQIMSLISVPAGYNSPLDYYKNLVGNPGGAPYSPATINTGWTFTIEVEYDVFNPPGSNYITFDTQIRDYHTTDVIFTDSRKVGDFPNTGFPYNDSFSVYIDYWRCADIMIFIR